MQSVKPAVNHTDLVIKPWSLLANFAECFFTWMLVPRAMRRSHQGSHCWGHLSRNSFHLLLLKWKAASVLLLAEVILSWRAVLCKIEKGPPEGLRFLMCSKLLGKTISLRQSLRKLVWHLSALAAWLVLSHVRRRVRRPGMKCKAWKMKGRTSLGFAEANGAALGGELTTVAGIFQFNQNYRTVEVCCS